ncbi:MAG TPA: alpha/beta fold hydrolase [Polyangiaceae bacterium]|nr:alpha/beta fold hydrolase [Polyangiaceae bacterium]
MSGNADRYPVRPGAEAYRAVARPGAPALRARTGVALIHGFTGSPVSMRPLAELLHELGFSVDVPRLPGHGTHPRDMARTRYADWRREVLDTIDRLSRVTERTVLVGLSMGGSLVLDVASSNERTLAGVVVINPQLLDRGGAAVKMAPLVERVLPFVPGALGGLRKDDIAKPGVSEQAYDWFPTAAGNSFMAELPRIREQLNHLSCPLLVAHSMRDHSVPPANSEALLKALPHARELRLERSYHVATLDYDLELLAEKICEFCENPAPAKHA